MRVAFFGSGPGPAGRPRRSATLAALLRMSVDGCFTAFERLSWRCEASVVPRVCGSDCVIGCRGVAVSRFAAPFSAPALTATTVAAPAANSAAAAARDCVLSALDAPGDRYVVAVSLANSPARCPIRRPRSASSLNTASIRASSLCIAAPLPLEPCRTNRQGTLGKQARRPWIPS